MVDECVRVVCVSDGGRVGAYVCGGGDAMFHVVTGVSVAVGSTVVAWEIVACVRGVYSWSRQSSCIIGLCHCSVVCLHTGVVTPC